MKFSTADVGGLVTIVCLGECILARADDRVYGAPLSHLALANDPPAGHRL